MLLAVSLAGAVGLLLAPEWAAPLNSAILLIIAIQQQLARRQAAREDAATRRVREADKRRRAR